MSKENYTVHWESDIVKISSVICALTLLHVHVHITTHTVSHSHGYTHGHAHIVFFFLTT